MAKYKYRLVNPSDFESIEKIWNESLPEDIFSILGRGFIQNCYLPIWSRQKDAIGLVAKSESGQNIGFVLFCEASSLQREILTQHTIRLIAATLLALVRRPILTAHGILGIASYLASPSKIKALTSFLELNYMGVLSSHQGESVGTHLVQTGLETIQRKTTHKHLYVKTLESTPDTHRFYKRLGFLDFETVSGRCIFRRDNQP